MTKIKKNIPTCYNEYKSTLIQERVHAVNFYFHDSAPLKFDLYQNGRDISHIYYALIFMVAHTERKQTKLGNHTEGAGSCPQNDG
jgi:hypothetical protein